jgi:hypothetical protein
VDLSRLNQRQDHIRSLPKTGKTDLVFFEMGGSPIISIAESVSAGLERCQFLFERSDSV